MAAAGIGAGLGIASALFQAHTARLQNATNENQAADILIPAFDADIRAVGANYESGAWSVAQCVAILQQIDANVYNYLRKQVGKTGTAWTIPANNGESAGIPCNKACTVGCCLYYNDLRPAIYGQAQFNTQGNVGMIPVLMGSGGQPSSGHRNQAYVPKVYPPSNKAYGNYQRAEYWISLAPPTKNIATRVIQAIPPLPGQGPIFEPTTRPAEAAPVTIAPPVVVANAKPSVVANAKPSVLGLLTNTTLVTIVTLIGGVLIIVAYLFGSSAVRVK